jgi:hypothetical protein
MEKTPWPFMADLAGNDRFWPEMAAIMNTKAEALSCYSLKKRNITNP